MKLVHAEKIIGGFCLRYILCAAEEDKCTFAVEIECQKAGSTVGGVRLELPFNEKFARNFFREISENEVFPQHLRDIYCDFLYRLGR